MTKLNVNLDCEFKARIMNGTRVYYSESPQVETLSRRALFWVGVALATGCALVSILGADDAHAWEMHVNRPRPVPGLPYCGTATGIAVRDDGPACNMTIGYPSPVYTIDGYSCPTQFHVAGREGALRCDEET